MTDVVVSQDWAPKLGGAHYWLSQVYERWSAPVTVLTIPEVGGARGPEEHSSNNGSIRSIQRTLVPMETVGLSPSSWLPAVMNARTLSRLIRKEASIIHCKAYFPEGLVAVIAKACSKKKHRVVVYAHGEELFVAKASRLLSLIAGWVFSHADLIIANSRNTANLLRMFEGAGPVQIIHPGVDVSSFALASRDRDDYRSRQGWTAEDLVVVTIARLEPRKNVRRVVDALAALRAEGLPIKYVCIGEGAEREALASHVRSAGMDSWVTIRPGVSESEKRSILCSADLHVMASVRHGEMFEGFGIVFLEAAAAGLASVSGDSGGQPEAVLNGRTGINVNGADVVALRLALRRLLTDKITRESMGVEGMRWALINDWDAVAAVTRGATSALHEGLQNEGPA